MPAPATLPARTPDPVVQSALAELLSLGLAVARVSSHLAQLEDQALDALAETTTAVARAAIAPAATLADAIAAGHGVERNDAARDLIAARVASITASFEKAARAVRRTAALHARLADPRPFHAAPPPDPAPPPPTRSLAPGYRRTGEADSPDRPETGDELGRHPAAAPDVAPIVAAIYRDLAAATTRLAPPPAAGPSAAPAPRPGTPPPTAPATAAAPARPPPAPAPS